VLPLERIADAIIAWVAGGAASVRPGAPIPVTGGAADARRTAGRGYARL
jgi:hypothetical protein